MSNRIPHWSEKPIRHAQLDDPIDREQTAYFGIEKVPSGDKARKVLQHFNRIARSYDLMNTVLSFGIHHVWKRLSIRMLDLKPGDRVIDVCGGTGDLALLAAQRTRPDGRVVVYDINRAMMQVGREKIVRAARSKRISFVQGDAEVIAFADNGFDAALVGFGIRNVTHMKKAFREMYHVLKPGGKLMCLEFSKPTHLLFRWLYDFHSFYVMPLLGRIIVGTGQPYTCLSESIRLFPLPDELAGILRRIGFRAVTYRRLTNGIAVIHRGVKPDG